MTIFIAILNMSITASVVALAVMLARIPLKKAPKIFSYALWGVVLIRLVLPFSIESVVGLIPASASAVPQDVVAASTPTMQTGLQFFLIPTNMSTPNVLPPIVAENGANHLHAIFQIATYVWIAGFVALLLYAVVGYISLRRRVYFATRVRDNIFETDKIESPFVLGFIRPKIYFSANINPARYDYILKHEQTHIKRRDYLIKPFAYMVLALHWFNPIMWVAYYLMSKDMEMSCDEAVLQNTSEDIRGAYSTSLLKLSAERAGLLNPITFAFGQNNVKERVVNVLSFKKPAKWLVAVCFVAVIIFIVAFTSNRAAIFAVDVPENPDTAAGQMLDETTDYAAGYCEELVEQFVIQMSIPLERQAEQFEIYREFGLVFDKEANHLYFNGELVRFFEDLIFIQNTRHRFGITHLTPYGTVDVRAVREQGMVRIGVGEIDFSNGLLRIEPWDKGTFDGRTEAFEGLAEYLYTHMVEKGVPVMINNFSFIGEMATAKGLALPSPMFDFSELEQWGITLEGMGVLTDGLGLRFTSRPQQGRPPLSEGLGFDMSEMLPLFSEMYVGETSQLYDSNGNLFTVTRTEADRWSISMPHASN